MTIDTISGLFYFPKKKKPHLYTLLSTLRRGFVLSNGVVPLLLTIDLDSLIKGLPEIRLPVGGHDSLHLGTAGSDFTVALASEIDSIPGNQHRTARVRQRYLHVGFTREVDGQLVQLDHDRCRTEQGPDLRVPVDVPEELRTDRRIGQSLVQGRLRCRRQLDDGIVGQNDRREGQGDQSDQDHDAQLLHVFPPRSG